MLSCLKVNPNTKIKFHLHFAWLTLNWVHAIFGTVITIVPIRSKFLEFLGDPKRN